MDGVVIPLEMDSPKRALEVFKTTGFAFAVVLKEVMKGVKKPTYVILLMIERYLNFY